MWFLMTYSTRIPIPKLSRNIIPPTLLGILDSWLNPYEKKMFDFKKFPKQMIPGEDYVFNPNVGIELLWVLNY